LVPNKSISWLSLVISAFITLSIFVIGILYIKKSERKFSDIV
jgi:ABC-type polysaccharide/polyol phosphate export permease